jgi:DNA repair protein RadC
MTYVDAYKSLGKYTKKQLIEMMVREKAVKLGKPSDVYKALMEYLDKIKFEEKESFFVATLDGSHKLINFHIVSTGLLNRTLVHPREVFRVAIKDNAAHIIIGHNHPSGDLTPSEEDLAVTKRLKQAGGIIGISVMDHIIVSPSDGYFSMLEREMF